MKKFTFLPIKVLYLRSCSVADSYAWKRRAAKRLFQPAGKNIRCVIYVRVAFNLDSRRYGFIVFGDICLAFNNARVGKLGRLYF
jgi:hypothetical protein